MSNSSILELFLPTDPAWRTQGWTNEPCSAAPRPHWRTATKGARGRRQPLLVQNFSLPYKGQSGKQGSFLKCCTVWGICLVHRDTQTQQLPRQENEPREGCEHPPAGDMPLFFPRQLSERCLFLQSRLWDLKEAMLSRCPKPMSMWPTHSHYVPWPFPITFSKSITWKIALLSSPEALETASKLCAYKQFQLGPNAIPASGIPGFPRLSQDAGGRGGRGEAARVAKGNGKRGADGWVRAELHKNPLGWAKVYPHGSEATRNLVLPSPLLQRAFELSEHGSHLLQWSSSLILLFFPSFSHSAHPLANAPAAVLELNLESGRDRELSSGDSTQAPGLVICWFLWIWSQNSSWATNTTRIPASSLWGLTQSLACSCLLQKRPRNVNCSCFHVFPYLQTQFPWQWLQTLFRHLLRSQCCRMCPTSRTFPQPSLDYCDLNPFLIFLRFAPFRSWLCSPTPTPGYRQGLQSANPHQRLLED